MSFEFLAPDQARDLGGREATARSPIEWAHLEAGAQLGGLAGWNLIFDYGGPEREAAAVRDAVGVADLCAIGKLELQGDAESIAAIVTELAGGARLEPGRAVEHDRTWWCPVTAGKVLALTRPEQTAGVREALETAAAAAPSFASVTELTAALGSNLIAGPLAREALARTTALDLRPDQFPEAAFAPVSVARTPGMVLRSGENRYLHVFGAGYAQYNWTVFVDAAESLGGRAVGLQAIAPTAGGKVVVSA